MTREDRSGITPIDYGPPEGFARWLLPEAVAERARRGALTVEAKDEEPRREWQGSAKEWKP